MPGAGSELFKPKRELLRAKNRHESSLVINAAAEAEGWGVTITAWALFGFLEKIPRLAQHWAQAREQPSACCAESQAGTSEFFAGSGQARLPFLDQYWARFVCCS
jgi:hypothetical protein